MLTALKHFGSYNYTDVCTLGDAGMPLVAVGWSGVSFREVDGTPLSRNEIDAREYFPELKDFDWPERGSRAELDSLLFQASRFRKVERPSGLSGAISELIREYPRAPQRACLRGEWDTQEIKQKIQKIAEREIKSDSSPGVPLSCLGSTNGKVRNENMQLLVESTYARLELLSRVELSTDVTAVDLVEMGLCDPVRLFVKQEPHPRRKIESRRFRLISSVSLVDQLVERILFGYQNKLEIQSWRTCPSKPGMGLSESSQAKAIWDDIKYKHSIREAAEADISGFDWSVQEWELMADVEMRISLGGFHAKAAQAARNRFKCLSLSLFQLSNGRLIAQTLPGLMKSGSYCTSSSNSRIRCLMAKLIGSPWCIAMGDDSIEGWVDDARSAYHALGHECKDYVLCEADYSRSGKRLKSVNFCSHLISEEKFYLTSWPKTLMKYLSSTKPELVNLQAELGSNPMWPKIYKYLRRKGLACDKDSEENGKLTEGISGNYDEEITTKPEEEGQQQQQSIKTGSPWDEDCISPDQPRFSVCTPAVPFWNGAGWNFPNGRDGIVSAVNF